ncbi:alpha/beta fold hydrolase [Pseudosulfitobacter koreensis]|uniref:Alpha/beta hydrolase n=1 Tax=Pseudosulfitobacter koreensis TaxID=2968472 RepID=A0ABT1YXG9_9RHOB|nr:alpha/beta hydrolase [Pseudosulfitobacter koreense]MCR8825581.1 alpha/beta hydrolase [Pseudosulfitobacter koreense]
MTIPGFSSATAEVNGQRIHYVMAGSGPPLLLLHGFPQTHAMWQGIAPKLAQHFTTVAADLRGYGASSKPQGTENYSFREMAADQVALMAHLGFDRFHLVGHDRGARTSHRAALDHPDAIRSLTLMDIVPTHLLLDDLQHEVARAYYHWFFLAQPAPLPETMIGHDPDAYFEYCLTGWGKGGLDTYDAAALDQYRTAWRDPDTIRGMCEDYRSAIDHDMALDAADLDRRVTSPALVLSGQSGVMAKHYDVGATWVNRLTNMQADTLPGGHFFPDQYPLETADKILEFLLKVPED